MPASGRRNGRQSGSKRYQPSSSGAAGATTALQSSSSSESLAGPDRGSRACCFCWCCCCSCSCLTVQSADSPGATGSRLRRRQSAGADASEERPSYEEVRTWGHSFERLMKNKVGQRIFADFCKSEYSDENILFWQACEDLKREVNPEKIEEKARIIYEDFISILSPKEVSLDSRVREVVNTNMLHPTQHTFDEAHAQIFTLMQRDSYPRFVNSPIYTKLLATYAECEDL